MEKQVSCNANDEEKLLFLKKTFLNLKLYK